MTHENPKISLSSRWCFIRDELVIGFPSAQLAHEYQRMNHEGRIYASEKDVYLPRPEGLISLRSSSQGEHYSLVLEFRSEMEARAWKEKVLISSMFPDRSRTYAYINKSFAMPSQVSQQIAQVGQPELDEL